MATKKKATKKAPAKPAEPQVDPVAVAARALLDRIQARGLRVQCGEQECDELEAAIS